MPKKAKPLKSKSAKKVNQKKTVKATRKGQKKQRPQKVPNLSRKQLVNVPTNKSASLIEEGLVKSHNFLSSTGSTFTEIYALRKYGKRASQFEIGKKPRFYSTVLKLTLNIQQTNDLFDTWTLRLWDITQGVLLDNDVDVTFVRGFERRDNKAMEKTIKSRRRLSILSSDGTDDVGKKSTAIAHDIELFRAIGNGDSVMGFLAEVWVTAPTEQKLERAVETIRDYIKTSDELRGLTYELDINKQDRPIVLYGPNKYAGNKDLYVDMTSEDAAISSLFVDSGGDRTIGSEYMGLSVGKLIRSHAAYNFQNARSLYIGNDTRKGTPTMGDTRPESSPIYLSKIASRSYLLAGKRVMHIVADDAVSVRDLMAFELSDHRKRVVDVAKGLLNVLEPIGTSNMQLSPERLRSRFSSHLDNTIVLLNQFRDQQRISTTDEFATVVRDILVDFYVDKKIWDYSASHDVSNVRLFVQHQDFPRLSDFGSYVTQRIKSKRNITKRNEDALYELDAIINRHILPTIPSLNTQTDPLVDELVNVPYKIIDLTGTDEGAMSGVNNPSMNIMMIAYLNAILPSLQNGDAVFIHGLSRMHQIGDLILDIINSSGLNLDIIFTEKNQNNALRLMSLDIDVPDFTAIDLHENRVDRLIPIFGIDEGMVQYLTPRPATFFIRNKIGIDYIYLDQLL